MTMTPEQIKAKQQKIVYQVVGATTPLPQTGKIEITDIWTAIKQNDAETTDKLYKSNIEEHEPNLDLMLGVACLGGHTETVKVLVENGANPDNGLYGAVKSNNIETVEYLLNKSTNRIQDALCDATKTDNVEMFNYLLSKGGDLNHKDSEPLRWAAMENSTEIMKSIILEHKVDPLPNAIEWLKENGKTYPFELIAKRDLNQKLQQKMPVKKIQSLGMKI